LHRPFIALLNLDSLSYADKRIHVTELLQAVKNKSSFASNPSGTMPRSLGRTQYPPPPPLHQYTRRQSQLPLFVTIAPVRIRGLMTRIAEADVGTKQQDAHEFLTVLTVLLNEESQQYFQSICRDQDPAVAQQHFQSNRIDRFCSVLTNCYRRCNNPNCSVLRHHLTPRVEEHFAFLVDISGRYNSLQTMLDLQFTRVVEGELNCPCNSNHCFSITKPSFFSQYLVLQLNRFPDQHRKSTKSIMVEPCITIPLTNLSQLDPDVKLTTLRKRKGASSCISIVLPVHAPR